MSLKWKRYEHQIVAKLRGLGLVARRTTSGRQGQEETADIVAEPFLIECKSTVDKKYATSRPIKLEWLRKVEKAAEKKGLLPVLVYNYPNRGSYAVLRLEDLGGVILPPKPLGYMEE